MRWIVYLKSYLNVDILSLDAGEVKMCAKLTPEYEIDEKDLLFSAPWRIENRKITMI